MSPFCVHVLLVTNSAVCLHLGGRCLAVTLQNERGGRQKCYSHDSSALVDGITPTASTGSFYLEKICVRKLYIFTCTYNDSNIKNAYY